MAPLLPLTFLVGYQADLAYGSKVARIRAEAENILQYERDLTDMPGGLPTIEAGRIKAQVSAVRSKIFNNADRRGKRKKVSCNLTHILGKRVWRKLRLNKLLNNPHLYSYMGSLSDDCFIMSSSC